MHIQTTAATKNCSTRRGEIARHMALVARGLSGPVLPRERIVDDGANQVPRVGLLAPGALGTRMERVVSAAL